MKKTSKEERVFNLNSSVENLKYGKIKEAEEFLFKVLDEYPDDHNALHLLGHSNVMKGEVDEGIRLIEKSVSVVPNFPEALVNLGNAYILKKKYSEAISSFQKAISLKELPGFWTCLGNAYFANNDIANAEISYQRSVSLGSNSSKAFNNLGVISNKKGNFEEAKGYFLQAINVDKNSVEALCNLDSTIKRMVPNWHIPMMNDSGRNEALLAAIKDTVKENDFVFEVGSGAGLLSMMSVAQGAGTVISCESSDVIADQANNIIKKNGYEKKIKIINKNSRDINVGVDLPKKADIIISEILSSEFVGENVLSSLFDARRRLLKDGGKMIPESGGVQIALLGESDFIKKFLFIDDICGFDFSDFNSVINRKHGIVPRIGDIKIISDSFEPFHFNFYSEEVSLKKSIDLDIEVNETSRCYGVVTWIKMNLTKKIVYENNPIKMESHWSTPVYLFKEPVDLKKGQKMTITCSIKNDRTWYDLK